MEETISTHLINPGGQEIKISFSREDDEDTFTLLIGLGTSLGGDLSTNLIPLCKKILDRWGNSSEKCEPRAPLPADDEGGCG